MAITITRHNIQWTAEGSPQIGQFANGDYWAVGPITISAISPLSLITNVGVSGRVQHGSMINPSHSPAQGFDSSRTQPAYNSGNNAGRPNNATLSINNPLVVPAGSSLISMRTSDTLAARPQGIDASVLTVLASAPAAGSFRPPFVGTNKAVNFNVSQIDWAKIPSLPKPANTPTIATVVGLINRLDPSMAVDPSHMRFSRCLGNQNSYGAKYAAVHSMALQRACLDDPQADKLELVIHMIQRGIDFYGLASNGYSCLEGGALGPGLKGLMVFAAHVLNSSAIATYCNGTTHKIFQEDRQTWYVEQGDVGRQMYTGDGEQRQTYTQAMADANTPEWGEKHTRSPQYDDSSWPDQRGYRNQNYEAQVGQSNAIRVMGARTLWNWPPFFDYADRVWENEGYKTPAGNVTGAFTDTTFANIQAFTHAFRIEHRSRGDGDGSGTIPDPAVSTPGISPGHRAFLGSVEVALSVSSPTGSTIRYTTDGSDPTASSPIYTGPFTLTATTQVKARGFKTDFNDSAIASAFFTLRYATSNDSWLSIPTITPQSGTAVESSFDVTPSWGALDGVVGLGAVEAGAYTLMAAIIQFGTGGVVKAINGASLYQAVNVFPYSAGVKYHVELVVNTVAKTYSATITAPGGSPVIIATDYAFRTQQATISELNYFSSYTAGGNSMALEEIYVGDFTPPTPQATIPVITPQAGSYLGQREVAISTALAGGTIHYTTNGSTPTTASAVYTGPFTLSANTTVKAITAKADYLDSPVATASFTFNEFTAIADAEGFNGLSVSERFTDIEVAYTATPSNANTDGVIGIGSALIDGFNDMAAAIRFGTAGVIEARNGGAYDADNVLAYSAGVAYAVVKTINLALKTYSVTVTPDGGSPVVIADNYAFRSEQANASVLAYIAGAVSSIVSDTHTVFVEDVTVTSINLTPPPRRIIKRVVNARRRR